jgi:membrane-associated phospholipid phosphatase
MFLPSPLAGEFLSVGEVTAVTGGTGTAYWLGHRALDFDTTRTSLLKGPLPLESSIQRFFGGHYRHGKRNFFDDKMGSAYIPLTTGTLLLAANLVWPQMDREKGTLQDLFLFLSGLAATKGVTDLTKGLVKRPRPYMTLVPIDQMERRGSRRDRSSFFSGHSSSAFFSAAYVNLRLRSIMRTELTSDEYHDWRWAPPSVLFGLASFVGLSRIHAYRHYFSDVLVGALAGYLVAELFFSFGENSSTHETESDSHHTLLRFHFSF